MPNAFIAIAERSGLIFELERWMLETACRRLAGWKMMGQGEGMRLAVNISGRHLIEGDLVADLDSALAATGADPHMLEIELTESQLLDDVARASSVLSAIRDRGVKVAIDDFGTGYSSMTYLQKLPVDVVKIDRSFIVRATTSEFDSTIIDTVVSIGRALTLEIVAEGIETVEQLAYAVNAGLSQGQGYLLARPMSASEAEAVIFNGPLFDVADVRSLAVGSSADLS
jgi:EAL domain-containing protein (putative c-di-GMP-specific phosphodiesterase class I)